MKDNFLKKMKYWFFYHKVAQFNNNGRRNGNSNENQIQYYYFSAPF